MLIQYVRKGKKKKVNGEYTDKRTGKKVGVLVAFERDGIIHVGHSKWNKNVDTYDVDMAKQVAIERAEKNSDSAPAISIREEYFLFTDRAKRYFRGAELSQSVKDILGNNVSSKFSYVQFDESVGC